MKARADTQQLSGAAATAGEVEIELLLRVHMMLECLHLPKHSVMLTRICEHPAKLQLQAFQALNASHMRQPVIRHPALALCKATT